MTEIIETQYRDDFHKADDGDGLVISFDEEMTDRLHRLAEARIREQREWFEPDSTRVAYHLSDVNKCLRQGFLNRYKLQMAYNDTGKLDLDALSGPMIQRFGRGYALQEFFIGRDFKEEALWSDKYRLIYSPDGGKDTPLEFKTTMSTPLVKADRESGLSIEDVLMTGGTRSTYYARAVLDWKRYMLQTMYLHGWTNYYLSVVFMNSEWLTFRYDATRERIAKEWEDSQAERRIELLHGSEVPGIEWRVRNDECDECQFLSYCQDELAEEQFRG